MGIDHIDWQGSIPFHRSYLTGKELPYIEEALRDGHLFGGGKFTVECEQILADKCESEKVLLTHSCTAALELAALAMDIQPGDEFILPSYTFPSTANAFALRGAKPVFVDVRDDTLNIDEKLIAEAITEKTRCIIPVHYAGVACEMGPIMQLAEKHNLYVVEDAAQGIGSSYRRQPLGAIGHMGALSFHATKNIISGEGGALIVSDSNLNHAAEVAREKGTDRSRFLRGEVDKYSWKALGSSYYPSELIAACLKAQLEQTDLITKMRLEIWGRYHSLLEECEKQGALRRPVIPENCEHNGHLYYVILDESIDREKVIAKVSDIARCVSHFEPLHLSEYGSQFAHPGSLPVTEGVAGRLLRLPLWVGLTAESQNRVVERLIEVIDACRG